MYCKYCGKEINDDADVCVHCGRSTNRIPSQEKETGETKAGVGILLCLFLGLIGLIIGVVAYPANTVERTTFVKGWGYTLLAEIIIAIIVARAAG